METTATTVAATGSGHARLVRDDDGTIARCGAKTRRGTACTAKPIEGKKRCKYHGGMSTGARTEEGKQRVRDAATRRWANVRAQKAQATAGAAGAAVIPSAEAQAGEPVV